MLYYNGETIDKFSKASNLVKLIVIPLPPTTEYKQVDRQLQQQQQTIHFSVSLFIREWGEKS